MCNVLPRCGIRRRAQGDGPCHLGRSLGPSGAALRSSGFKGPQLPGAHIATARISEDAIDVQRAQEAWKTCARALRLIWYRRQAVTSVPALMAPAAALRDLCAKSRVGDTQTSAPPQTPSTRGGAWGWGWPWALGTAGAATACVWSVRSRLQKVWGPRGRWSLSALKWALWIAIVI